MLTAERMSAWNYRFRVAVDGEPVAVWDTSFWRTGGSFEADGRRFQVRSHAWGTKFRMLDEWDNEVARVERAGRKNWTVWADGRAYEFRRASLWGNQQDLLADGVPVGSLRRTSTWSGRIEADLPGMPLPVETFVVGVRIAMWQSQRAATAAS